MHRFAALALGAFAAVAGLVATGGTASAGAFLSDLEARACEDPSHPGEDRQTGSGIRRSTSIICRVSESRDLRDIHEHRYLPL